MMLCAEGVPPHEILVRDPLSGSGLECLGDQSQVQFQFQLQSTNWILPLASCPLSSSAQGGPPMMPSAEGAPPQLYPHLFPFLSEQVRTRSQSCFSSSSSRAQGGPPMTPCAEGAPPHVLELPLQSEVAFQLPQLECYSAQASSSSGANDSLSVSNDGGGGPHRSRRTRKRGPKGNTAVVSRSGSGWTQSRDAMVHGPGDLFLFQEVQKDAEDCLDAADKIAKDGVHVALVPSVPGPNGGNSAGVGIGVKKPIAAALVLGDTVDFSPPDAGGRVAAMWANAICKGGVLLISAYFFHSEGWSARNHAIMLAIGSIIKRFGGPWILSAGWNMHPKFVVQADWERLLSGRLCVPDLPTFYPAGEASTFDYFMVAEQLFPCVKSTLVDLQANGGPHYPVLLEFEGSPRRYLERVLGKPKAFPVDPPAGPRPKPSFVFNEQVARENVASSPDGLDELCSQFYKVAEEELLDVFQIPEEQRESFCGRGAVPHFYWRLSLPPPSRGDIQGPREARSLRWLSRTTKELSRLVSSSSLKSSFFLVSIVIKVQRAAVVFDRIPQGSLWVKIIRGLFEILLLGPSVFLAATNAVSEASAAHALFIEQRVSSERSKGWFDWVAKQSVGSAGALHRWTKPPQPWRPLNCSSKYLVSTQAHVDEQTDEWSGKIWSVDVPPKNPQWPQFDSAPSPVPITPERIRRVSKGFAAKAGMGGLFSSAMVCLVI